MFFDSWAGLGRVIVVGTLAYALLVLTLRISGKRTLAKFNAFDLVVTVALGSSLATVLLSKSVPLAEGILAFGLLSGLQFTVSWLSVRSPWFGDLVKSEPTLVFHKGQFLDSALLEQRITRNEIMAAVRSSGVADLADVTEVVLETDGSMSVVQAPPARALTDTLRHSSSPVAATSSGVKPGPQPPTSIEAH